MRSSPRRRPRRSRQGWSDITYYVAASKAGVFNLGTMGFANAPTPGITYPSQSVAFAKKVIANNIVRFS
ncbi:hypothetical protein [Tessaracoccus flavescens]|uniref:hypothetical protein n=1 Tax=Tessaracoccus flavescens TaxID=399497 RepID=UPI0012601A39|nr:hypothetical protein [Tessaracoccus flavescens]